MTSFYASVLRSKSDTNIHWSSDYTLYCVHTILFNIHIYIYIHIGYERAILLLLTINYY